MRRAAIFSFVFALTLCGSFRASANDHAAMDTIHDQLIEGMARDFFERSLHPSQQRRVEATTSTLYIKASAREKQHFRAGRMAQWLAMSETDRLRLRQAKMPVYDNLTERQKDVFRAIARTIFIGGSAFKAESDFEQSPKSSVDI